MEVTEKQAEEAVTKKKGRRPRQENLPAEGMAPKAIPELDEAAEAYIDKLAERRSLLEEVREAKGRVLELMKKHGLEKYRDVNANILIELEVDEKVSVRKEKDASDDVYDDDED
jgi:hypothetical protein